MSPKGVTRLSGKKESGKRSFACRHCRDSGWVIRSVEGIERAEPCRECRSQLRRERRLKEAGIPPRYFERGFDVYFAMEKAQEKALQRAVDYVDAFPNVPRGLLFAGPCGVGKTHLSVAVLKNLIEEKGIRGRFVDETELLRRLQYSYGPDSPETEREVLLPLMEVELLVWDDLGTGRPTEWVAETIRTVINHRYTYNKQTILTTNLPLKAGRLPLKGERRSSEPTLEERVGRRLYSRILEMCEIIEVDGPDARTEIHKARLDFQENRQEPATLKLPSGLFHCPRCRSKRVQVLDHSKNLQDSTAGTFVEVSCLCQQCSEHFLSRFFPRSARVEYPFLP